MKRIVHLLLLFFIHHFSANAQPGALDPTFNSNGIVVTDINNGSDVAKSIAVQLDGKIVVGGNALDSATNFPVFCIARYNDDGSPDTSFASTGHVLIDEGVNLYGLAIAADGKIVVAGGSQAYGYNSTVCRYLSNGLPDSSFNVNGKLTLDFSGINGVDWLFAMTLQSDHKILISGYRDTVGNYQYQLFAARLKESGTLDSTFGNNGIASFNLFFDQGAMIVQNDGKIIIAGSENKDFTLIRLLPSGAMDLSFGINGKVNTDITAKHDFIYALALRPDGRIIAAGTSGDGNGNDNPQFCAVSYLTDGTIDSSFGNAGILQFQFQNYGSYGRSCALQPDGKLLMAGFFNGQSAYESSLLVRFDQSGNIDLDFNGTGSVSTDVSNTSHDAALAVAIQPDGKIVCAGETEDFTQYDFMVLRYLSDFPNTVNYFAEQDVSGISVFPNPFSDFTTIQFSLYEDLDLKVELLDLQGRKIKTIADGNFKEGSHELILRNENMDSGVYLLQIKTNSSVSTQKLIIL